MVLLKGLSCNKAPLSGDRMTERKGTIRGGIPGVAAFPADIGVVGEG